MAVIRAFRGYPRLPAQDACLSRYGLCRPNVLWRGRAKRRANVCCRAQRAVYSLARIHARCRTCGGPGGDATASPEAAGLVGAKCGSAAEAALPSVYDNMTKLLRLLCRYVSPAPGSGFSGTRSAKFRAQRKTAGGNMKNPGNGRQGQTHGRKRDSKGFFTRQAAPWRGAGKLKPAIPAMPLSSRNFSAPIYPAGMAPGAAGLCFQVLLLWEENNTFPAYVNTLKKYLIYYLKLSDMLCRAFCC